MTVGNPSSGSSTEELEQGQDSAVLQALRDKVKDQSRIIKELEGASKTAREQVLAEVKREASAVQIVSDLGFPKLAPLVVEKIQGNITEESVKAFLDEIGLVAPSEAPAPLSQPLSSIGEIASVASLGQQLASAARGTGTKDVTARLQAATTPEEVAAIAAEAGLLQSY